MKQFIFIIIALLSSGCDNKYNTKDFIHINQRQNGAVHLIDILNGISEKSSIKLDIYASAEDRNWFPLLFSTEDKDEIRAVLGKITFYPQEGETTLGDSYVQLYINNKLVFRTQIDINKDKIMAVQGEWGYCNLIKQFELP